jgi:predicted ribosome quality control (RQC) complex YloA/Tae2 family protein
MLIFSGTSYDVLTVKTPSFFELKTLVEILSEEMVGGQLQEINATEDGLVLTIYRFQQMPRTKFLVFDLDKPFPFLGIFDQHPWPGRKKSKPTGLFLNAHAKNLFVQKVELVERFGRVVQFILGRDGREVQIQFRLIPKQANFLVETKDDKGKSKTISWYPVQDLIESESHTTGGDQEDQRSIPFMMKQWWDRRSLFSQSSKAVGAANSAASPFEKWQKQKQKDIAKKTNALAGIQKQIDLYRSEPWSQVGEHLKAHGFKGLPPEWSPYVAFDKSVSENMQNCFARAKSAKAKIHGALERQHAVEEELSVLKDLSEARFESDMKKAADRKNKAPARAVEGRLRKLSVNEQGVICYMGKSAQDNLDLLRKSKAWDYWMHLKDYPGAHAIVFRQKDQVVSDQDLIKCARWLVKEGLGEKQLQLGGRFAVVMAECRHVRPIKGDKLGRVTYHEGREFLIAL